MADRVLTADVITAEAIMILDNNLGMAARVHRGHESEYASKVNGYKKGETVSIRKPADYIVRDGRVASIQDAVEGKTTITIDKQKGVDLDFTSADMTLKISDFSERFIQPAMAQLANQIDLDLLSLYSDVSNWVGTPGETIDTFSDFAKAPERMSENAVPMDNRRSAMLAPGDNWGLVSNQTGLFQPQNTAYREGSLGRVGGIETFESQNVQTHTNGDFAGTVLIDGAITTSTITYDTVKDTNVQTIHIDGLTTATAALRKGDSFTIAGVFAVNPVTKQRKSFLKQFTLTADATASSSESDIIISPAMIWSGAHQTIDTDLTDLDNAAVTFRGTELVGYNQNLAFHRNAFALVAVPMERPQGAVSVTQKTYKGISARLILDYDWVNDTDRWRLDMLYGVRTLDERLAVRVSGTAA